MSQSTVSCCGITYVHSKRKLEHTPCSEDLNHMICLVCKRCLDCHEIFTNIFTKPVPLGKTRHRCIKLIPVNWDDIHQLNLDYDPELALEECEDDNGLDLTVDPHAHYRPVRCSCVKKITTKQCLIVMLVVIASAGVLAFFVSKNK